LSDIFICGGPTPLTSTTCPQFCESWFAYHPGFPGFTRWSPKLRNIPISPS
jgi:hypothetical protein